MKERKKEARKRLGCLAAVAIWLLLFGVLLIGIKGCLRQEGAQEPATVEAPAEPSPEKEEDEELEAYSWMGIDLISIGLAALGSGILLGLLLSAHWIGRQETDVNDHVCGKLKGKQIDGYVRKEKNESRKRLGCLIAVSVWFIFFACSLLLVKSLMNRPPQVEKPVGQKPTVEKPVGEPAPFEPVAEE